MRRILPFVAAVLLCACGEDTSVTEGASAPVPKPNNVPTAFDLWKTLDEDTSLPFLLSGNDADGDALTFGIVAWPLFGTITGTGASLTYTPLPHFNGIDVLTYYVFDGEDVSLPAVVTITINAVNDPPTAHAQSRDAVAGVPDVITLTGSDIEGDVLEFTVTANPLHGVLSGTPPSLVYVPDVGYSGYDTFDFVADDGTDVSAEATVEFAVNGPPVAHAQFLITDEDTLLNITLTGTDPDADPLFFEIIDLPQFGILTGSNDIWTYVPDPDYSGADSFTFQTFDGTLYSGLAAVDITVNAVNDPPVAQSTTIGITAPTIGFGYPTTLPISDVDSTVFQSDCEIVTQADPANGEALWWSGTWCVAFNGPAPVRNFWFTYRVFDGTDYSSVATVWVRAQ